MQVSGHYYNGRSDGDSVSFGSVIFVIHRWHELCQPGKWIVTFHWTYLACQNYHAVVDDFGDLVPVPRNFT